MEKRIEQLREEKDFLQYTNLLREIAKTYVVMIVACDTPWWYCFTKEMTRALKGIGLTVNLYDKYRQSYAAVLDAGHVIFEKLAPSEKELITRTVTLGEHRVDLLSASFDAPGGRNAYINIDGKTVSTKTRGLNIVVYDKENNKLLDAVNVDTFEGMQMRHSISVIFNNYMEDHLGTQIMCFNTPIFPRAGLTINENFIKQKNVSLSTLLENPDQQIFAINRYYQKEEVAEALSLPKTITDGNRNRTMADRKGTMVNIADGHRVTELQPPRRKRTVFLLGEENVYGVGVSDLHTSASFLQSLFDQNMPEKEIVVENYGQYFAGQMTLRDWEKLLDKLPVCPAGGT